MLSWRQNRGSAPPGHVAGHLPVRQNGQAMLLSLMLGLVAVLIGLALINNGILSGEKMQLQNAADATAYSVSLIEARDLNFSAYTNRAMVANEVAMAQLVGLMSWANMVRSIPEFLNMYLAPVISALAASGVGAPVAAFLQGFLNVFRAVGTGLQNITRIFTQNASRWVAKVNRGLSIAQRSVHVASFLNTLGVIDDMIDNNATDARLSAFGALALLRHFTTHYGDFARKGDTFVTSYRQNKKDWNTVPQRGPAPDTASQQAGMARLSALVNASRDPFSRNRDGGWNVQLLPPINIHRCFIRVKIPFVGRVCLVGIDMRLDLYMDRHGGSDNRFIQVGRERHYNWSAVDVVSGLDAYLTMIIFDRRIPVLPRIHGVPLGIGGAQAGRWYGSNLSAWKSFAQYDDFYKAPDHAYGGIPQASPVSWFWPIPFGLREGPFYAVRDHDINKDYRGLPRYNDTRIGGAYAILGDQPRILGWESPYVLISLVKETGDIPQSPATGRFRLDNGAARQRMSALGKAEVYFSRPNNLWYYRREDGRTEHGNAFNPYWDARLVDTSYIDRTAALTLEQHQPWLSADIQSALDRLQEILGSLL